MADVIDDDAIAEALNACLPSAPADMRARVDRHVARRTRARHVRVAATTVVASLALVGSAFALVPHGRAGHVQVSHDGRDGADARNNSGATPLSLPRVAPHLPTPPSRSANGSRPGSAGDAGAVGTGAGANGNGASTGSGRATGGTGDGTTTHNPPNSPNPPVQPPTDPSTPVSQLTVTLYDDGLHVSATRVLDDITVTFHDMRSDRSKSVSLFGPTGTAADGQAFHSVNGVGPASFRVTYVPSGEDVPSAGPVFVNVFAPVLPAPSEPDGVFTIEIHADAWTLPFRSVGASAPYVAGVPGSYGGRWTDVHEGTYQLVVKNPDHRARTFTVPGLAGRQHIAPNQAEVTFTMTISARADRKWAIEPTDQGYRNAGEGMFLWIQ